MTQAADISHQVRSGALAARQVVAEHLALSQSSQADLNAFTIIDHEGATRRVQALGTVGGEEKLPLAGVPIALKDLIDQAGLPTTCGSSFYRRVPQTSAAVVERLERAGAVILGRTCLHEFAFGFSSENPWWGPVRNPWNRSASPGGSSGGTAAAVAAGLVPAGIGTDTGGSVRVPAALCGVIGLKVTHGRLPLRGVFPLAPSLDTVGPIARSVADTALLFEALAGHDPGDPWSAVVAPEPDPPHDPIRIGVPQPWVAVTPTAGDVADGFRWALDRLADLGMDVSDTTHSPAFDPPGESPAILYGEAAVVHRPWFPGRRDDYGADVAERLEAAQRTTLDDYVRAQEWRSALRQEVTRRFQTVDVLVTPATAVTRKLIGEDHIEVEGQAHHYRPLLSAFSSLVNHMGNPALVLPLAVTGEPPLALQLIGPWWGERRLLALGARLEAAGVAVIRRPPYWAPEREERPNR